MISAVFVAALVLLALATQAGCILFQRLFHNPGKTVEISDATLNILDIGPKDAAGPPIVLIHGASSNLEAMRHPIGTMLAARHRVILFDRPGHGWSSAIPEEMATPAAQGRMIEEALKQLGVGPVILVGHSWAGALVARMALDFPERVAGLVMLAPVTHPWEGGVGWYNEVISKPVIGPLLAYTITLPLGYFLLERGARQVFQPQVMPDGYVADTQTPLLLRPREFIANARDLVKLKQSVIEQAPRYAEISAPAVVISGDSDNTVFTNIHSRPFAATVKNCKLIVLPGVGHMVQNAKPELVVREIENLASLLVVRNSAAGAAR